MTTDTATVPAKTERQTWRDWLAPGMPEPSSDELLTRDELVERLNAEGVRVTKWDLRNWQSAGVIPYGVRQWRHDATYTLYPIWMLDVLRALRDLQAKGRAMTEMGPELRIVARAASQPKSAAFTIGAPSAPTVVTTQTRTVPQSIAIAIAAGPDAETVRRLTDWARAHGEMFGANVVRVEVRLIDERGHALPFAYEVAPEPRPKD